MPRRTHICLAFSTSLASPGEKQASLLGSPLNGILSFHMVMVTPCTSYPFSLRKYAATDESMPPLIPTRTFSILAPPNRSQPHNIHPYRTNKADFLENVYVTRVYYKHCFVLVSHPWKTQVEKKRRRYTLQARSAEAERTPSSTGK